MTPGQIAYEAYANETGNKSLVTGDELPEWNDLSDPIRIAWEAAARAVIMGVDI